MDVVYAKDAKAVNDEQLRRVEEGVKIAAKVASAGTYLGKYLCAI